jgi:hypothetical protein
MQPDSLFCSLKAHSGAGEDNSRAMEAHSGATEAHHSSLGNLRGSLEYLECRSSSGDW